MLKPLLFSPALLLLAFWAAPNPQQKPSHKPAATAEPATIAVEPARAGTKQMYKFDCAICHGETGNGKGELATSMSLTLDDWTNPATISGKSDQQLFDMIRKGKDKMPPEDASRAKDDEVRDLVKYIRSFAANAPASPAPAAAPAPDAAPAAAPATPPAPSTAPNSPSTN